MACGHLPSGHPVVGGVVVYSVGVVVAEENCSCWTSTAVVAVECFH